MEASQVITVSAQKSEPRYFVRFNVRQRIEHILLIVLFVALALTGLVQRFYTVGVSEWLIMVLGGIEQTRLIHRIFAMIFTAGIVYHFIFLTYALIVQHKKPAALPTFKDFRDIVAEVKHSLGFRAEEPKFGRYDYRQKFEYIGLMFGSFIIIVTGFILMYPVAVTSFLPGQVVAVALVFHGYEATLAVLVIVIWHLYDVILKPGIFPADTTIFTGKISRERMKEEHSLEYDEIVKKKQDSTETAAK